MRGKINMICKEWFTDMGQICNFGEIFLAFPGGVPLYNHRMISYW